MYPLSARSKNPRCLSGLVPALILAGCATTRDCDPRVDPGFIGSINCHASDAYQGRIVESQKILANEQELMAHLAKQAQETGQTKRETEAALRAAQADLDRLDGQLDAMRAALKGGGKSNKDLQAKLAGYQKKITALKKQAKSGHTLAAERDRLRRELDQANEEVRKLTGG